LPLLPPAFAILTILNTQFKALPATTMVKSDSKKRAQMMAKEWKKSRSNTRSLNDLVGMGLLHNHELGGWRAPEGESYPEPCAGEIIVFEDYFKRGFRVPIHPFLQGLLLYYEIGICNLHPNSIPDEWCLARRVVGNFLARRVMPCQRRVHSVYEYVGSQDLTRMHRDSLEKSEIQRLMNELFNLADNNFVRSDDC